MKLYAATDKGSVRELNEDSFYIPGENGDILAVADGMGGHNAGEVASAMAISVFREVVASEKGGYTLHLLRKAVVSANAEVYSSGKNDPSRAGMGTTFTAIAFRDRMAMIAHVGDTRAYLIRGSAIMQLTLDHTLVRELYESGAITAAEAKNHPQKNVITRALGTEHDIKVDTLFVDVREGDRFLVCSDGLHGVCTDDEMLRIVTETADPRGVPGLLIERALANRSRDNITCVLACAGKGGR